MNNTFYFSHDYNARTDEKIKKLIRKHGMEGYGTYWAIVEDLYQNANALQLDCEGIAYDMRVSENIVEYIINDSGLFVFEDGVFYSKSIQKRLDERDEKSAKARESARKRWDKSDANALRTQSDSNAIKERKGKENKGKEIENKEINNKESKDSTDLKKSDTGLVKKEKNPEIDNLIQELKTQAELLGVAYDKKQERNFGRHITKAKEFGNFCEKIGQDRIEFAKNIMIASEKIKFWKGTCAGPMLIYQNYAEVYNLTKTKSESSKIVKIDVLDW